MNLSFSPSLHKSLYKSFLLLSWQSHVQYKMTVKEQNTFKINVFKTYFLIVLKACQSVFNLSYVGLRKREGL